MTKPDILPRSFAGITLRRLTAADRPEFQAYRGDPAVGRFQGWRPMSDEEATAFLCEMGAAPVFRPGQWCQIGLSESGRSELIGDLGLCLSEDGQRVELGFSLRRAWQGHGRATAAVRAAVRLVFDLTDAECIECVTDARNEACVRLLERIGMTRTGTASAIFRGETCEEHRYMLTRREALRLGLSSG